MARVGWRKGREMGAKVDVCYLLYDLLLITFEKLRDYSSFLHL